MALTIKQIKALRSQAHALKPVVMIGQNGLTDNVIKEIQLAIEYHELIKVRIGAADRQQRTEITARIAKTTTSEHIQSIGHIGVFYRRNPKRNRIQLPKN
jgi:RNA-binding protein